MQPASVGQMVANVAFGAEQAWWHRLGGQHGTPRREFRHKDCVMVSCGGQAHRLPNLDETEGTTRYYDD